MFQKITPFVDLESIVIIFRTAVSVTYSDATKCAFNFHNACFITLTNYNTV